MFLLTYQLRQKLPALYSQEDIPDPTVVCKFFTPWSSWTWYATEGGPVDDEGQAISLDQSLQVEEADYLFFGLVAGLEAELGYFSLDELAALRGPGSLRVERDLHWTPKPLSEVRAKLAR